jgi:hypothetical protein
MSARAAWREPMLWLVAALPAAVLGAAAWTIVAAAGGSDATGQDVRRTAQIQVEDLAADREAARLGLEGELLAEGGMLSVRIARAPAAEALLVTLEHPAQAGLDRRYVAVATEAGWQAPLDSLDTGHAWNVRVGDAAGTWRLYGRWAAHTPGAGLRPALER